MKPIWYLVAVTLVIALTLAANHVMAQPQPQQSYGGDGGGMITGSVYGFDMYDALEPIAWATVNANNGRTTFTAYSGGGGYYEMYVPSGFYNVTVIEPGYVAYTDAVNVAPGSASSINFYLEQSHVPVPEFPSGMILSATLVLTLSAALLAIRRTKRRK
jgi:hypothetical protein